MTGSSDDPGGGCQRSCFPRMLRKSRIVQERSAYVGSCTTIGNRSKIIGRRSAVRGVAFGSAGLRRGEGWKRREVRRKRNGRAYRASSPATSKPLLHGKLSRSRVRTLLDVPRPRVPQLTSAKTPHRDVCHRLHPRQPPGYPSSLPVFPNFPGFVRSPVRIIKGPPTRRIRQNIQISRTTETLLDF